MSTNTSVSAPAISTDGVRNIAFEADHTAHNMALQFKRMEAEEAVIASMTASAHEARNNAATAALDKIRVKPKSRKKKGTPIPLNDRKKNRQGRKGDPRMHRAVAARLADSSISLLDALRKGGFDYPPMEEDVLQSMYTLEDSDGVQLGQRKNQLSRRLRLLRKEAENGGSSSINDNDSADGLKMKADDGDSSFHHESDDESERGVSTEEYHAAAVDPGDVEDVGDGIGVVKVPMLTTSANLPELATVRRTPSIPPHDNIDGKHSINVHETGSVSSQPVATEIPKESFQQQLALTNLRAYNNNNIMNTDSQNLLLALQQQRQLQLVAAASRSNIMMQSNVGSLLHHSTTSNLGNYVQSLYTGQYSTTKKNASDVQNDQAVQTDLTSVLSPDSLSRTSSRDSRGSRGASSDASSFFKACKKIEGRELNSLSTFAMSVKSRDDKTSGSSGTKLPPPLFETLSPSADSGPSLSTSPVSIPKLKPISDDDDVKQVEESSSKNSARARRFREFFKMQRSFVKELFEFAGESHNEEKLRSALDTYRVESASLVKSSMIKAGFGPETINECDSNYLAFIARKLDYEVRRVERLVEAPPQQKKKKNLLETQEPNALNKRTRLENEHSTDNQHKLYSFSAGTKVSEIIYNNLKHNSTDRDDISSLGNTIERDITSIKDEDFIPMRVPSHMHNAPPLPASDMDISPNAPSAVTSSSVGTRRSSMGNSSHDDQASTEPIQIPALTEQELGQAVLVHESPHSKIFTTSASGTNQVTLKVLNLDHPSSKDVEGLFNEYSITRSISHDGVRKALDRVLFKTKHALVLEWVDGKTIKELGKCAIPYFLHIARQMAAALSGIHLNRIIHMNLTYTNIMICSADETVRIIDFRHATRFYNKNPFLQYSEDQCRADFLPFMAPERTGRVKFKVDSRSDLYSLGIIYYFLLSGKLPFDAESPSEWMAMHVTKPIKPLKLCSDLIPGPLSDLVAKLTNKNPDDRYLSAESLLYDLDLMLLESQLYGSLNTISISTRNYSRNLIIPQRIYGKDKQKDILLSSWKRINSNQASTEAIFINGSSGVGKSMFLSELRDVFGKQSITVPFNLFSLQEPFAALTSALRHWMTNLLKFDDVLAKKISDALKMEVGKSGRKLLSKIFGTIPALFGEHAPSTEQGDEVEVALDVDVQARLYYVFQKLFLCLSSVDYPLVLTLEDIHLADPFTLSLFSSLMMQESFPHYLLIFTYEQSKVAKNESCISFIQKASISDKIPITKIEIKSLSKSDLGTFCADVLYCTIDQVKDLSDFIYAHTDGNFHFTVQLILLLSDQRLIRFCSSRNAWVWDMDLVSYATLPSNVEELYRQKLLKLDSSNQTFLKVASCIDKPFSVSMLESVDVGVHGHMNILLDDGILEPSLSRGTKFRFSNNVIQNLAYSLITQSERNAIRMKAGIALMKNVSKKELEDRLLSIGNHLDAGWQTIMNESQKIEAAKIFLRAGQKAGVIAAFPLAVQYITCAIQMIKPIYWKQEYDLSLQLTNTLAEISFNIRDFGIMQESMNQITRQAKSVVDMVPTVSLYMKSLYHQKKYNEALSTGMATLKQLGESFPNIISDTLVLPELQKTRIRVSDELQNILSGVKKNENATALATLCILSEMISLCPECKPALRTYIIIRFMQITIEYGKSKHTPYALAMFGSVLFTKLDDVRDGHRFGKMSVSLIDDSREQSLLPRIYACYYISISHWKEHAHLSLPSLLKSYKVSLELGCSLPIESSSSYILLHYGINCICSGKSLHELVLEWSTLTQNLHNKNPMFNTFLNILCCLVDKEDSAVDVSTLLKNDSFWSNYQASASNDFESFFVYLLRMILCYHFNEISISKVCMDKCQDFLEHVEQSYSYSVFFFYYGLVSVSYSRDHPGGHISQMKVLPKLKKWSIDSSSNYLNKLYFLEAEMAVTKDDQSRQEVMHLLNESISLARANQFYHEEALACERMIDLCVEWKNMQTARSYYNQALHGYETWGCSSKVNELIGRYSYLEASAVKIEDGLSDK